MRADSQDTTLFRLLGSFMVVPKVRSKDIATLACCINLKGDNFVVLKVICETKNLKVMTIFKEPRIGYSAKNIPLTSSYNDRYVTYETRRSDPIF